MKDFKRLPRKVKKTFSKRGLDYKEYLREHHRVFNRNKHLDKIFTRDYTSAHESFWQAGKHHSRIGKHLDKFQ